MCLQLSGRFAKEKPIDTAFNSLLDPETPVQKWCAPIEKTAKLAPASQGACLTRGRRLTPARFRATGRDVQAAQILAVSETRSRASQAALRTREKARKIEEGVL